MTKFFLSICFIGSTGFSQLKAQSDTLRLHFVSLKLNTALTSLEQVEQVKGFLAEKKVSDVDVKAQKIQFSLPFDYQNPSCKLKVDEVMNHLSVKGYQCSLNQTREQLVTKTPVDSKVAVKDPKEKYVQPAFDGTQDR